MAISYFYLSLFCRTAVNFYLYGVSIVLQLVNFLPFAIALCLYNHLSLSLMFLLLYSCSLVTKEYVAACIK